MTQKAVLPAAPPPPEWGNVPQELSDRRQWLMWRFEVKPGLKKPAKMPYYANGGRRMGVQGDDADRASLATLADARRAYDRGGWSGIGFAFLPGDGLIGIDIDGAIDPATGEISARCQSIIEACNSFTEYSPSRKGVHIIVLGTTETNKSNDIGVEMFCGRQFLTHTSWRWPGSPADITEISPAVLGRIHRTINDAKADAAKAKGVAPLPTPRAPRPALANAAAHPGSPVDDFRRVNDAAMNAIDAWVPSIFPAALRKGQDYRVSSKSLNRNLQEDLVIGPEGIMDWGVHDMGDPRGGKRSPVDLVMEWLPTNGPAEALRWLAQRIGVEIASPRPRLVPPAPRAVDTGEGKPAADDPPAAADATPALSAPPPGRPPPPKKKEKKEKPEPDWGKLEYVLEHFRLIYGTDMVWDGDKRLTMKIAAMAHAHGSDIVRMWKLSALRRTVMQEDMVFDPTEACDLEKCVNLYNGFAMEADDTDGDDVDVMLELLDHLCGNCSTEGVKIADVMHWVLCWLALPLQQPGAKMKSALVFHGPQGTGKNLFFDAVRAIYGSYGVMVGQNELEEKYTSWLSAKLMVIGNEVVTRQELYHNKNKLKWVISEEVIPIRAMNMDVRWERNHANVVFLSNEQMPLVLEDNDRRYLVVYTPSAENGDLYKRVAAFLARGGSAKLLNFLLKYDLKDFGEHTKPIMTAAKADLIELGMRPSERFMSEWLQGFLPLPMRVCSAEQLYRAFKRWCDQAGERYPPPRAQFTKNAERWIIERVERSADGKVKDPKLIYKVVQLKGTTGARTAARCWIPSGANPPEGKSEGEWAAESVVAFEADLSRFTQTTYDIRSDPPVTPDA